MGIDTLISYLYERVGGASFEVLQDIVRVCIIHANAIVKYLFRPSLPAFYSVRSKNEKVRISSTSAASNYSKLVHVVGTGKTYILGRK